MPAFKKYKLDEVLVLVELPYAQFVQAPLAQNNLAKTNSEKKSIAYENKTR